MFVSEKDWMQEKGGRKRTMATTTTTTVTTVMTMRMTTAVIRTMVKMMRRKWDALKYSTATACKANAPFGPHFTVHLNC
jgi:hypothetical protein